MPTPEEQLNANINANIATSRIQPIFADSTGIALRIKAIKTPSGAIEKEGFIEIIFIDMLTQKPVGEFVLSKNTAKELVLALNQNIINLEKQLASKDMPKPPAIKTTSDSSNSSYR